MFNIFVWSKLAFPRCFSVFEPRSVLDNPFASACLTQRIEGYLVITPLRATIAASEEMPGRKCVSVCLNGHHIGDGKWPVDIFLFLGFPPVFFIPDSESNAIVICRIACPVKARGP